MDSPSDTDGHIEAKGHLNMTRAQLTYLVRLTGGLAECGAAAIERGLIRLARSNKRDRENALLDGVTVAEASDWIDALTTAYVDAGKYADNDDCLSAAAADYAQAHGLESWQVTATWEGGAGGQRDRIALKVPAGWARAEVR